MEARLKKILSQILECGIYDIDYILHLEDMFGEMNWEYVLSERINANMAISHIFADAVGVASHSLKDELCIELHELEEKVEIYCNALDSHLYIKSKDGDYEEMYNIEQIKKYLLENYGKERLDKWFYGLDFLTLEKVTRFKQCEFNSKDGYQEFVDACDKWWTQRNDNDKKQLYKTYRTDDNDWQN
jgi:hypothetical protein